MITFVPNYNWLLYSLPDGAEKYLTTVKRVIDDFPVANEGVFILKDLQQNANDFESIDASLGDQQMWEQVNSVSNIRFG